MTQAIAKYAAKKMLSSEMNKYKSKDVESQYDPFYEMVPHPRKPGKFKKVKKQIPAYIPEHDADILARARKTAYKLDFCLFNLLGFRFGWSSVIGLVPVAGDGLDMLLAINLILRMRKVECGLPAHYLLLMIINMALDFKCNSKNVRLLESHLDKVYKPKRLQDEDEKLPQERRPRPATVYEDFSDEEEERRNTFDDHHDDVRRPTRAYSSRKERIPDEEMGVPRRDTHRSHKEQPSRHRTKSSRRH